MNHEVRMLLRILGLIFAITFLSGCVSSVTYLTDEKIVAPKVIALNASKAPWIYEIQKRLKKEGFKVLRSSSRSKVTEQINPSTLETYNKAEARYVLDITGHAPLGLMRRCVGGGYKFDYISVDLVDINTNETILNYSDSGYSENCPPLSGNIFSNITEAVLNAWE